MKTCRAKNSAWRDSCGGRDIRQDGDSLSGEGETQKAIDLITQALSLSWNTQSIDKEAPAPDTLGEFYLAMEEVESPS